MERALLGSAGAMKKSVKEIEAIEEYAIEKIL